MTHAKMQRKTQTPSISSPNSKDIWPGKTQKSRKKSTCFPNLSTIPYITMIIATFGFLNQLDWTEEEEYRYSTHFNNWKKYFRTTWHSWTVKNWKKKQRKPLLKTIFLSQKFAHKNSNLMLAPLWFKNMLRSQCWSKVVSSTSEYGSCSPKNSKYFSSKRATSAHQLRPTQHPISATILCTSRTTQSKNTRKTTANSKMQISCLSATWTDTFPQKVLMRFGNASSK